ncbi:Hypothetical predicted protein [Paramuricea clavata]|uniref:Uncharacterized protein n=1 Tax=Paramuricea clavata TaxID=317549 RepID=A0A6S7KQ35_PARCT|nr:Hypothetical predicted protein [Paramuricea clavata]
MVPQTHSSYRIAKKIVRHHSNISFLRTCKYFKVIPNGLQANNILAHTTNSRLAESLALKHSRQWLQLAINTQYDRLSKIRGCVFPLNQQEDHDITRLRNSLAETKESKLKQLLNRQRKLNREYEAENKPQGFKNLSSETLDNQNFG